MFIFQTIKESMTTPAGIMLILAITVMDIAIWGYFYLESKNYDSEKHNMLVDLMARLIVVGLGFVIISLFNIFCSNALINKIFCAAFTVIIILLVINIRKLDIWEER